MSSLHNDFINTYCNIACLAHFRREYENSWVDIDRSHEVSAIREYLLNDNVGIDYLNHMVSTEFQNTQFVLKFASVFCHQKPGVKRTENNKLLNPGDTPGCELGDLFVLFLLMDGNDNVHYSAGSIFQAKLTAKLDSKTQRHLYDYDNEFVLPKYICAGRKLHSNIRKMPTYAEGRANAFRYLILNPSCGVERITARHSPWTNNYQLRWSTFIDGLLSGVDGLKVNLDSNTGSSWDEIVKDLLWVVANVKKNKPPRGNNDAVKIATGLFNNYSNIKERCAIYDEGGEYGMPLMLIIAHAPDYKGDVINY
ncbi:hypothetical protein [Citrobacter sp. TBCS-14]|uniref:hypothetical protein n=1 Tax=Citrobacter sp. TBCS-14 TaxID=2576409 RepID=UPI00113C05A0|nr:hypothetical protein [Citrobacter sp. TBCS-14]TKU89863.1 hypothetical protein FDX22_22435 [Citrobacter sp. TBCS-14]